MSEHSDLSNSTKSRKFSERLFIDGWMVTLLPIILFALLSFSFHIKFVSALYNPDVYAKPIWDTLSVIFLALAGLFLVVTGFLGYKACQRRSSSIRED